MRSRFAVKMSCETTTIDLPSIQDGDVNMSDRGKSYVVLTVLLVSLVTPPLLDLHPVVASNFSPLSLWSETPHVIVYAGETAEFFIDLAASSIVSITVLLSIQDLPSNWFYNFTVEGREIRSVHLEAGKTLTVQLNVEAPEEASNGEYEFSVTASGEAEHEGYSFHISEKLALTVEIQSSEFQLTATITTAFPEIGAPAGSSLKYPIEITNEERTSDTFTLAVETPENWTAVFKSEDEEIYRIYLDAGETTELTVELTPPSRVRVGTYSLKVTAESLNGRGSASLPLMARISGSYEIEIQNVNFYTSVTAGQETSFLLDLKNSGDSLLSDVKVVNVEDVPEGFTVSMEPNSISSLEPNEETSYSIIIVTDADVNAGSYYLEFKAQSDQTETSDFSVRVDVRQQASYLTAGIILVIVAVIAMVIIFRRFGRR